MYGINQDPLKPFTSLRKRYIAPLRKKQKTENTCKQSTIRKNSQLPVGPETFRVWYGMVWDGMVWYGMVCYGMVWYVWYKSGPLKTIHILAQTIHCAIEKKTENRKHLQTKHNQKKQPTARWARNVPQTIHFSIGWYGMVWYGMLWYGMVCMV
jgi:hypothetical protein